jgi:cytochrome c oxidase assembly protein subunit 11
MSAAPGRQDASANATGDRSAANGVMLRKLVVVAGLMFGFGFALVPFYEKICEVTGIRNVFQPDAPVPTNTQIDATRQISVEFDANLQRLPWTFRPLESHLEVHPGELKQVVYEVKNLLDRPVTGQAVASYGPALASQYFTKYECFCFREQTLAPGETRKMPVVFMVDPKLPADVNTITLSYTFFEVNGRGGRS